MEHYYTNNENLKSEFRKIEYTLNNTKLSFLSDLGVFSKDKIDYGSLSLTECILKNAPKNKINKLLDVGCGYGFIGITLSKFLNCQSLLVDVNKRAIHLANMNIKENNVVAEAIESNTYANVKEKYDLIVSNPPIRAGKNVVLDILTNAKEHLNPDGELWYVIRKDQGAKSIEKIISEIYNLKLIDKSKGFYIYKAKIY